jgi:hypothetical protein
MFKSLESHTLEVGMFRLLPELEVFRRDPRYSELLRRGNLL